MNLLILPACSNEGPTFKIIMQLGANFSIDWVAPPTFPSTKRPWDNFAGAHQPPTTKNKIILFRRLQARGLWVHCPVQSLSLRSQVRSLSLPILFSIKIRMMFSTHSCKRPSCVGEALRIPDERLCFANAQAVLMRLRALQSPIRGSASQAPKLLARPCAPQLLTRGSASQAPMLRR